MKIISGGQTGADLGGVDAAIACGVPYGGMIPSGRRYELGAIPDNYTEFVESDSYNYLVRTEQNVKDSDVTLVFSTTPVQGGTKRTIQFARKHNVPYFVFSYNLTGTLLEDTVETKYAEVLKALLEFDSDVVINVAGSRESKCEGIHKFTKDIITKLIQDLKK